MEPNLPFHSFSSCDWLSASYDEGVENKQLDRDFFVFHRLFLQLVHKSNNHIFEGVTSAITPLEMLGEHEKSL